MKLSMPRVILHLEGFAMFIAALVGFSLYSREWGLFAILFLCQDALEDLKNSGN